VELPAQALPVAAVAWAAKARAQMVPRALPAAVEQPEPGRGQPAAQVQAAARPLGLVLEPPSLLASGLPPVLPVEWVVERAQAAAPVQAATPPVQPVPWAVEPGRQGLPARAATACAPRPRPTAAALVTAGLRGAASQVQHQAHPCPSRVPPGPSGKGAAQRSRRCQLLTAPGTAPHYVPRPVAQPVLLEPADLSGGLGRQTPDRPESPTV
jgi:hypothetical protein